MLHPVLIIAFRVILACMPTTTLGAHGGALYRGLCLQQQNFTAQLKIGVRRNGESLEAHAWVEYMGRVINDNQRVAGDFVLMNPGQNSPDLRYLGKAIRR